MATYYFDSIAGNDANTGASWAQAWSGSTKQIATYIGSGNVVWLRGTFANQVGGTFSNLSGFELRPHPDDGATLDCRTRHSSGWTNVSSSKVWKKTYAHQVHRVIFGSGTATGFVEGSDVAKRLIVSTSGSWTTTAASDAQVVAVLDAGSTAQGSMWYWDGVSDTLYVRSTNSSTDPDTAYGGVWTVDGSDASSADRRRWTPFYFSGCSSLFFGSVQVRGAVKPLVLDNSSGTIEPYLTEFTHYQWPALTTIGGNSSNRRSLTINAPRLLMRRPYFANDISQSGSDDGNGVRNQGGADTITIEQYWSAWNLYGGTIEAGVHGSVTSQGYHGARITSGLIQGTFIDLRALRYGRAFNLQSTESGAISAFVIERVTVEGQPTNTQVNWDNLTIRNCVWRNGRDGWFGDGYTGEPDKYQAGTTYPNRWRNSHAISLSYVDGVAANNMVVEDSIFYGQKDAPFDYQSTTNTSIVVRNNWCIRNSALAGTQYGDYILFNDTWPVNYGTKTVTFSGNKHAGGFNYVPSGFTAMSGAEQTLYTARAQVQSFSFSPSTATPTAGATQSVTVSALGLAGTGVADFAGTVATSAASGTATATAPSGATGGTGQVAMTVAGVANGITTITLRSIQGAATGALPVNVGSEVGGGGEPAPPTSGVRVLQSAIATVEGGASVSCAITGLTAGSKLYAFAGGYFDGGSGLTLTDSRVPAATWTSINGGFHTGGTSTSIGIFARSSVISSGTPNVTVTASPTKSPAATNAFLTLILVEVADAGTVQASDFAIGKSATPTVDLASVTAPALVLAGTAQSGTGNPTISAGTGFSMLRVKNAQAGIGVEAKNVTTNGQNDPTFTLTSTVDGIAASDIEWPAVALVINESVLTAPAVTTSSLPGGTVGTAYSQTLAATGSDTISWSISAGTLPGGLSLNTSTGAITGTPTVAGTSSFTATATNGVGASSRALFITVSVPTTQPAITTASLPDGLVGDAYSQPLAATGTTPITWAITSGTLPSGLALNPATGVIAGTPTVAGTSSFVARAANSAGEASRALSILVSAQPVAPTPDSRWTRVPRDAEVWIRIPRGS